MTDAVRITRSADHQYTYAGKTYPGVTSILGVIDKSGPLMAWAARQTAEAAIDLAMDWDRIESITRDEAQVISSLHKLLDTVGREGAVKALTARSGWKRDEAAALGTAVHGYADDHINGRPIPELPDIQRRYVDAYADWWKDSGWTLRTSEAFLVHPEFGYGGTLDLLCRDRDGKTVLADIKTGKAVYKEAVLQLTAYGQASVIQTPAGQLFPMPAVDRYAVLHVTGDGVREVEVNVGRFEQLAFAACLDLYAWTQSMKGKKL